MTLVRRRLSSLVLSVVGLSLCTPAMTGCGRDNESRVTREDPKSGTEEPNPGPVAREGQLVMTWVSVWSRETAKEMLDRKFGKVTVEDTLDRIGLQFWTIRSDGTVEYYLNASDEDVAWFVERFHAKKKQVLLTVVNEEFDAEVMRSALGNGGAARVAKKLAALVDEKNLDGVDIDFESGTSVAGDRELYAEFIDAMSAEMKARKKLLTVDSFYGATVGAPGPRWWSDWAGKVDVIHVMGYDYTYYSAPGSIGYQALQDRGVEAGYAANQIFMGLPMWVDSWGGKGDAVTTNAENLRFIANCLKEPTGVALWELGGTKLLEDGSRESWTTDDVWSALQDVHDGVLPDEKLCREAEVDRFIIDDMGAPTLNRAGGKWIAVSDYWSRPSTDAAMSSKVLTSDKSYDIALGEGSWGKTELGYVVEGGLSLFSTYFETLAKLDGGASFAALRMEFLERDCALLDDPADGCSWRPASLVDQDLSASKKLVVGLRCTAGEKLSLELQSRATAIAYGAPAKKVVQCTGDFEDYEIVFSELSGFDPKEAALLDVKYVDPAPPHQLEVTVAGIRLDGSVLEMRGLSQ